MSRMVAVRLGQAIISLLVAVVFVFFLVRLTGDPVPYYLDERATPEDVERVRTALGLDKPLSGQLTSYVGQVATGDLGYSYRLRAPVLDKVLERLPATLAIAAGALVLTLAVGFPLGVYSAYYRGGMIDRFARGLAALGQSVPSFWFGLVLIIVFAINLAWLPSGGQGSLRHLILPAVTLALEPIARLTRLLRSSMIEELGSDHVKFHRIKGLRERRVLWKHALRNAGLTTLTFLGVMTAGLATGSVLVETVFIWPGIGRLLIESVQYRDFAMIQGLILLIAAAFILVNLLIDVLYMVLNPRLRVLVQK